MSAALVALVRKFFVWPHVGIQAMSAFGQFFGGRHNMQSLFL